MSQSGMIMPICKDTEGNQLSVAVTRYAPVLLSAGVALLVSLWYQFGCQEVRNTFFSDSRHYLETCRQLVSLVHRTPGAGIPMQREERARRKGEGAGSLVS